MVTFFQGEPSDRASTDPTGPCGSPHAATFVDVLQDRLHLASEEASGLVGAVAIDDVKFSYIPFAPVVAFGIETAEGGKVVHDASPPGSSRCESVACVELQG